MCGIAGKIGENVTEAELRCMASAIAHRGPDDAGFFVDSRGIAGLAHRRLAIIQLSPRPQPPISTGDGRYTITFNGEIYNYIELRDELKGEGAEFSSDSDTEVLLEGYARHGSAFLPRLTGMFAFAIWDRDERKLFLARDRVGKKPIVYFSRGGTFAFASELKALLALPAVAPKLRAEAVEAYLAFGYIPAPLAIFSGIRKLPPGHWAEVRDANVSVHRYWFPESATEYAPDARSKFQEVFADAVRLRLRSDVPIAIFLSGGIDSSAVAAEVRRQGAELEAFTVVFDGDTTDLPYAQRVAKHLGLPQRVIDVSGADVPARIGSIVHTYDEPFADSSCIPSYLIGQAVCGMYKVVLNGDGGDEAFAGYRHYEHVALKQRLKRTRALLSRTSGGADPFQVYFGSKSLFNTAERKELTGCRTDDDALTTLIDGDPFLQERRGRDDLHRALWADRHVYLPNDLLYKMDLALMAHGVEGRSPLLDHRLLEWAQSLPGDALVSGREKKLLLRDAFRGVLPDDVLDRPKHGFGAPIRGWLAGPLHAIAGDVLPTPLLNVRMQRTIVKDAPRNERAAARLWALLTFALWAREWNATW